MTPADIVGALAAVISTTTLMPQVVRVLRTGETEAISLATFVIVCVSATLWGVYGALIGSWPIIVTNGLTLPMGATILVLKLRQVARDRASARGVRENEESKV
ncbi:MAG: hypothetical protein K2Q06_12900 [Parvularculaceae bacterium]|nr:hypothetical protein [Parvularculaceae bacterium]